MAGPTNYLASYIDDHKGVSMSSLEIDVLINKASFKLLKLKHVNIVFPYKYFKSCLQVGFVHSHS
jgi:hypothetical protein